MQDQIIEIDYIYLLESWIRKTSAKIISNVNPEPMTRVSLIPYYIPCISSWRQETEELFIITWCLCIVFHVLKSSTRVYDKDLG